MSPFLSFVRRLRPIDLLLPVGAALVSAGLQNLADRETRQRTRLDELAALAADHVEAFTRIGVVDDLPVDEQHPLDPGVPWLASFATPEPAADEPSPRRRGWKLAAVALAAVSAVAIVKPDAFGLLLDGLRPYPWRADDDELPDVIAEPHPHSGVRVDTSQLDEPEPYDPNLPNAGRETERAPWETCTPDGGGWCDSPRHRHEGFPNRDVRGLHPAAPAPLKDQHRCAPETSTLKETSSDPEVSAEVQADRDAGETMPAAIASCGWPNCEWTSSPEKTEQGQLTQAAVHRQRCIYRPAGAGVSPA